MKTKICEKGVFKKKIFSFNQKYSLEILQTDQPFFNILSPKRQNRNPVIIHISSCPPLFTLAKSK